MHLLKMGAYASIQNGGLCIYSKWGPMHLFKMGAYASIQKWGPIHLFKMGAYAKMLYVISSPFCKFLEQEM